MSASHAVDRSISIVARNDEAPVVLIVDDDVSVRESLALLLHSTAWRVDVYSSAQAFLARSAPRGPACLVLDVSLPDLNGLELQERLGNEHGVLPIIFISGYADIPMSVRAMKAGAAEFLTKPINADTILAAIEKAIEQSRAALTKRTELQTLRNCYSRLTPREREVMASVVSGRLNKQIARELGISQITVKAHRGKVMRKMNARSLAALVKMSEQLAQATLRHREEEVTAMA